MRAWRGKGGGEGVRVPSFERPSATHRAKILPYDIAFSSALKGALMYFFVCSVSTPLKRNIGV